MELAPETIVKAQAGDTEAQALLLRRYARALRHLVVRRGRSSEAEDQMQELYEKILAALPRFRLGGEASLGTWVFAVAHNWLVSRQRRPSLQLVPFEGALEVPDTRPSPDSALETSRDGVALAAAIERLPESQRRIFVLAQLHHQPLEAIAETEGLPLGTVKSRLHRARAALVLMLGDRLGAEKGGRRASIGGH